MQATQPDCVLNHDKHQLKTRRPATGDVGKAWTTT